MWTFIFCVAPLAIATLPYALAALKMYAAMQHEQAKADALAARLQSIAELREVKIAEAHNKVVLQDLKIETEKLKQEALKQKLGITDNPFNPERYE